MFTNCRTENIVTWTRRLKCDLFITKCLLECVIQNNVCKIEPHTWRRIFSLELLHFLGKYPGHGSNLYGYLWVDADSISANITNNRARREKVSKWLIFSLSRPGRTESHSSIYPSQPVSGQCKQNQKLVCIRKTFQSWLKNKWLNIGNCDLNEAGQWFVSYYSFWFY